MFSVTCVLSEVLFQVLLFPVLPLTSRELALIPKRLKNYPGVESGSNQPHIRALQVVNFMVSPFPVDSVYMLPQHL